MGKYLYKLLALESYVYEKYGRTYIRNYVALLVTRMVLMILMFMTLEMLNN